MNIIKQFLIDVRDMIHASNSFFNQSRDTMRNSLSSAHMYFIFRCIYSLALMIICILIGSILMGMGIVDPIIMDTILKITTIAFGGNSTSTGVLALFFAVRC